MLAMTKNRTPCGGFTLIELMVTLTIAAVLLMVAIPNLSAYKRNAELTSATNTLLAAINAARSEAMKRNMYAMVVPTNNGSDWNSGWVVFVDKNRTQAFDGTADQTVMTQSPLPGYFNVSGNGTASGSTPYVMFDGSGYSRSKSAAPNNLTLTVARTDLTGATLSEQTRRIVIAVTGRARACRPSTDTSCSTSAAQ
jgi:type IV fimbrial biogenesis protein FimT